MKENRKKIYLAALAAAVLLGGYEAQAAKGDPITEADRFFEHGAAEGSVQWGEHNGTVSGIDPNTGETISILSGATGRGSTAWGNNSVAFGESSTAWGNQATATGDYSTAWGAWTKASGIHATAWGVWAEAKGDYATAWGDRTHADGRYATAWGSLNSAVGDYATAWGYGTTADLESATAWGGYDTLHRGGHAFGKSATAFGITTKAFGLGSTAWGYNTEAGLERSLESLGQYATAWGIQTQATESGSTAWGGYQNSTEYIAGGHATGLGSTAFGTDTTASGVGSTSWGYKTTASGDYATAFGNASKAYGNYSLAALGGIVGIAPINGVADPNIGARSAAIGAGATVTVNDTLALGSGSLADRDVAIFYNNVNNAAYMAGNNTDAAWKATHNAIAIGSDRVTRQLIGVAAGTRDTDAVNVAQLKSAVNYLENKIGQGDVDIEGDKNITVTPPTADGDTPPGGDTPGTGGDTTQPGYQIGMKDDVVLGGGKEGITSNAPGSLTVVSQHGNITVNKDNDGTVKAGNVSIGNNAVKVGDKTYISDKGLNANDQKVANVANGDISASSKDAVNGSQLYDVQQQLKEGSAGLKGLSHELSRLDGRVDKAVAGAAALAALNPLDYDPEDKLSFAAGYGHYGGEGATAIGAYYQPNENVRVNVGSAFGNGEEMWNAGVSFKLGHGNTTTSRAALAKKVNILENQNEVLTAQNGELIKRVDRLSRQVEALLSLLDETKEKDFPDVPSNHWAYEAVSKLGGSGLIQGDPDGQFHGDRTMTRYELAQIVYNTLKKGQKAEAKLVEEFRPELEQIAAKDKQ